MAVCDVCGNEYARAFQVSTYDGKEFTFDCIECAATRIAPSCAHCGCTVLGHGIGVDNTVFCCAHCARSGGVSGAQDHVTDA